MCIKYVYESERVNVLLFSLLSILYKKKLKNIKIDNPGYDLCGEGILEYDFEKTLKFVTIIHKSYIEILKI